MDVCLENRIEFFQKIGPDIAHKMTEALQRLTAKKIKVQFSGVQAFEEDKILVDAGEKCFGSFVRFSRPEAELEGIVVIFFPLSSSEMMTRLLLKHQLNNKNRETTDSKMKLSAFREATHILLATYIAAIANGLGVKLQTTIPKFVGFHNFEFLKPGLLMGSSKIDNTACIGKFGITGPGEDSVIKGLFISAF